MVSLFNIVDDPAETKNLAEKNPDYAQPYVDQLLQWKASLNALEGK